MVGGENRGIGSPGVAWKGITQAEVTMGCVASGETEAFSTVRGMIMRRANNVAQVAVSDVECIGTAVLGDW
jgi:6,7-dimethyl-8-ribityllumazine synthase